MSSTTHSPQSTFVSSVDQAASTIFACGEHQKKIIDDILNVSKMDAGLFTVEPIPVQPHVLLQKMMRMFGPEFRAKGITSSFMVAVTCHLSVNVALTGLLLSSRRGTRSMAKVTGGHSTRHDSLKLRHANIFSAQRTSSDAML